MQVQTAQKHLFYDYLNKWNNIVLSTKPKHRLKAQRAIEYAYEVINLPCPVIYFASSPKEQQLKLRELSLVSRDRQLLRPSILVALWDAMRTPEVNEGYKLFDHQFSNDRQVYSSKIALRGFAEALRTQLRQEGMYFAEEISSDYPEATTGITYFNDEVEECTWLDFAEKVLAIKYPPGVIKAFQGLIKYCGQSFHLRDSLVVCDRPKKLQFKESLLVDFEFGDNFGSNTYSYT